MSKHIESFRADFASGQSDEACATTFEQLLEYAESQDAALFTALFALFELGEARLIAEKWKDEAILQVDIRGFNIGECWSDEERNLPWDTK